MRKLVSWILPSVNEFSSEEKENLLPHCHRTNPPFAKPIPAFENKRSIAFPQAHIVAMAEMQRLRGRKTIEYFTVLETQEWIRDVLEKHSNYTPEQREEISRSWHWDGMTLAYNSIDSLETAVKKWPAVSGGLDVAIEKETGCLVSHAKIHGYFYNVYTGLYYRVE